ncbi:hypothetical protein GCM10009780_65230 [Actinomadura alba]
MSVRSVACHHANVLPYAAYLRVYEPLTAFAEPERSAWAQYADSRDRPRRATALQVEHAQALRRLLAAPPVVVPGQESRDAYVRRSGGMTYVSPWQTRLRSWVAFTRFRDSLPAAVADAFVPAPLADQVTGEFERWKRQSRTVRPHILSSTWHIPIAWFVPFVPAERWLVLTSGPKTDDHAAGGGRVHEGDSPVTPAPVRTLVYVTSMAEARRRVERAVAVVRSGLGEDRAWSEVQTVGWWLAEFHAEALVELDYGGLVQLFDDQALSTDQSVAEASVALAGLEQGKVELTLAMYRRLLTRWRFVRALEAAN